MRKLYLDFDLSMREIAELSGSLWPRTSIVEALKLHGIHHPTTPSRRLKYGERVVKGKIVSHPREQKILALMRSLANEGRTPYGVAKYLNLQGLKGKRGGKWDKNTVRAILERR